MSRTDHITSKNVGAASTPPAQAQPQLQSPAQLQAQTFPPTPTPRADTHANQSPSSGPADADTMALQLLSHVVRSDSTLLPSDLPNSIINSTHIDKIAHAMWQTAFKHGLMLQQACMYSAMFAPTKLAALAKLNFLPSWWFFREMTLKILAARGLNVDDSVMNQEWQAAVSWCRIIPGVGGGSGGQGDEGMKTEGGAE